MAERNALIDRTHTRPWAAMPDPGADPLHGLLPATPGVTGGSGLDAPTRRTTPDSAVQGAGG
jgi:hypothetical protein